MPVAPPFPDRSLEAVGFASGGVAQKEVLEGNVAWKERGEEEPLDERLRRLVQAL